MFQQNRTGTFLKSRIRNKLVPGPQYRISFLHFHSMLFNSIALETFIHSLLFSLGAKSLPESGNLQPEVPRLLRYRTSGRATQSPERSGEPCSCHRSRTARWRRGAHPSGIQQKSPPGRGRGRFCPVLGSARARRLRSAGPGHGADLESR
jgi:hypothetical protein